MKCLYCKKIMRKLWKFCPSYGEKYPISTSTIKTYAVVEPTQIDRIEKKIDILNRKCGKIKMDEYFDKHILIESRKQITTELEDEITQALTKIFTKHNNEFRHITDFEFGRWFPV